MEQTNPRNPAKGITRFEDLRVFQQARELCHRVHTLTRTGAISRDRVLVDQMRRAVLSIVSNIAEGFERQSNAEFARFLYIAKGSCGELRAQALVALDEEHWTKTIHDEINERCRRLGASLSNLILYLNKSAVARKQQRT
jgi:four helix bundle protein